MLAAIVRGVAIGSLYSLFAIALAVLHRGTRSISFAHGELGAVAAFVGAAAIATGWPWLAAAGAGVLLVAVLGGAFAVLSRRLPNDGVTMPVATSALLLLIVAIETKLVGVSPRTVPQPVDAIGPSIAGYHLSPSLLGGLGCTVAIVLAWSVFVRTDAGLVLEAVAADPAIASTRGVRVRVVQAATWATSAAISAVAALLLAASIGAFVPGTMTSFFVRALAAMLLGGAGRVLGAAIGGMGVGIVEQTAEHLFLTSGIPGLKTLAVLALILAVLGTRRHGVVGAAR